VAPQATATHLSKPVGLAASLELGAGWFCCAHNLHPHGPALLFGPDVSEGALGKDAAALAQSAAASRHELLRDSPVLPAEMFPAGRLRDLATTIPSTSASALGASVVAGHLACIRAGGKEGCGGDGKKGKRQGNGSNGGEKTKHVVSPQFLYG